MNAPHLNPFAPGWAARLRDTFGADLLAAIVVSVLLIPQSLAYALLAGLPPEAGLYASLLPLLAYAAIGSSPLLGIGPVAVLALMIAQAVGSAGPQVSPAAAALVLAAEVGLLLAAAALLRLDALAALLSVPVLHGFETGAALSIVISQLPVLLGAPVGGGNLPQVVAAWWASPVAWHVPTVLVGALSVALLWLVRERAAAWLGRWLPARGAHLAARLMPLAVIAGMAAGTQLLGGPAHGVAMIGALPALNPTLAWPALDPALWWQLLPSAVPIALVGFVSSLVAAESLGRRRGQRVMPRRELAGLAAANLAAAVSGGMPVAASFSRSVLNLDAGSRTRLAGALTAVLMGLAIWGLSGALALLPKAVLAASIVVAVATVFQLEPFRAAWRYDRAEGLLMAAVAVLTVVASLTWALALGVCASVALLLQRSAVPHVALVGRIPGTEHFRKHGRFDVELTPGVMALRIDESLLFLNARWLAEVVQGLLVDYRAQHGPIERVVLLMSPVNHIDLSGLEALRALHDGLAAQGLRLDLAEVKGPVLDALERGGYRQWFRGRITLSMHQAMLDEGVT